MFALSRLFKESFVRKIASLEIFSHLLICRTLRCFAAVGSKKNSLMRLLFHSNLGCKYEQTSAEVVSGKSSLCRQCLVHVRLT